MRDARRGWARVAGSEFPGLGPGLAPASAWQPFWSRSRHLIPDLVRLSFALRTRTATSEAAVLQIFPVDGAGCSRTVGHVRCPGDAVVQPLLPGALVITPAVVPLEFTIGTGGLQYVTHE